MSVKLSNEHTSTNMHYYNAFLFLLVDAYTHAILYIQTSFSKTTAGNFCRWNTACSANFCHANFECDNVFLYMNMISRSIEQWHYPHLIKVKLIISLLNNDT